MRPTPYTSTDYVCSGRAVSGRCSVALQARALLAKELIKHSSMGEISEILVYNRVLCEEEAAAVENYLAQKYGLH